MIVFKTIKPNRFKDAEFKRIMRNATKRAATQIQKDFELTTRTWENVKPEWKVSTHVTDQWGGAVLEVYTEEPVYKFVDEGTKPHEIWAGIYTGKSKKKKLAFASVFSPKTKPGVLGSVAGKRGKVDTFRAFVKHPGAKARGFTKLIEKKRQPWFQKEMQKAMAEAAKASGHGL